MAVSTQQLIAGLYAAFFNRAPDKSGLDFWSNTAQQSGLTDVALSRDMAKGFANHPYFNNSYGHLGNAAFIDAIYVNVGGAPADASGKADWLGKLNGGTLSRADFVADFVFGLLNISRTQLQALRDAGTISAEEFDGAVLRQDRLTNKTEVGLKYAQSMGAGSNLNPATNPLDAASLANDPAFKASQAIIASVTEDAATKNGPTAYLDGSPTIEGILEQFGGPVTPPPGATFMLTTGADPINGSNGNDTINALSIKTDGAGATTFSAFDAIDGGAGVDTLNIYTTDDFNTDFPANTTVKNVEIVNIHNAEGAADLADASKFEGVEQLWQIGAAANVTKLAATTTAGFRNVDANIAVAAADAAATAKIALDSLGEGNSITVTSGAAGTLNSVTVAGTVKDTNADKTVVANALNITVGKDVESLSVNTANKTTLTVTNGAGTKTVSAVDASASAGAVTYNAANTVANVKTGAGDDFVTLNTVATATSKTASVATGEGKDTVNVFVNANGQTGVKVTVDAGAGDDEINVNNTGLVGIDIKAGAGNDTVTLVDGLGSLASTDKVDGGEGTDTLVVEGKTLDAEDYITLNEVTTGFEAIEFTTKVTADASRMAGYKTIETAGDSAAVAAAQAVATAAATALANATAADNAADAAVATATTADNAADAAVLTATTADNAADAAVTAATTADNTADAAVTAATTADNTADAAVVTATTNNNAALTTLAAADTANVQAQADLATAVSDAAATQTALDDAIAAAAITQTALDDAIAAAAITQTALDDAIADAAATQTTLDNAIADAAATQATLDTATTNLNTEVAANVIVFDTTAAGFLIAAGNTYTLAGLEIGAVPTGDFVVTPAASNIAALVASLNTAFTAGGFAIQATVDVANIVVSSTEPAATQPLIAGTATLSDPTSDLATATLNTTTDLAAAQLAFTSALAADNAADAAVVTATTADNAADAAVVAATNADNAADAAVVTATTADNAADAAVATATTADNAADAAVVAAQTAANNAAADLSAAIAAQAATQTTLDNAIADAAATQTTLDNAIAAAAITQADLDAAIAAAAATQTTLDNAIADAAATQATLNAAVVTAAGTETAKQAAITADAAAQADLAAVLDANMSVLTKVAADQALIANGSLNATATGYVLDSDTVTAGNQTTYAGSLNITAQGDGNTITAQADSVSLKVAGLVAGDVGVTLTGDVKSATVALTNGVNNAKAELATEDTIASVSVTATGAELKAMTTLTLTGNGQAAVTNFNGSALVTVDASALGGTYALGADKGDTTFGLNYLSTSAKAETVKLGSGIDWINLQNSTVKNMDTVTGLNLVDNADVTGKQIDYALSDVLMVNAGSFEKVTVEAASLNLALIDLAASATKNEVVFTFGGDTYIYADNGTDANFVDDADVLVKVTGSVDLDLLVSSLNAI